MHHELRLKRTPKGVVKLTPWGYQAECPCGWVQPLPAGTFKDARLAYYNHKAELKD